MDKKVELNSTLRSYAVEKFIDALKAAPGVFKKELTGEEFAKEIINGAQLIGEYLYEEENDD